MSITTRPAVAEDAEACGHIMFDAFRGIADAHGFPPDVPSADVRVQLAAAMIAAPSVFAVVAESDGRVVGSNFLAEGDAICAVGPITVDPAYQGGRVGRRLMEAVLERARGAPDVRLVQDTFNTRSFALYASLGFEAKEPLLLMRGTVRSGPGDGFNVQPLTAEDLGRCAKLCATVHGVARTAELGSALRLFTPFAVERDGQMTGYLTAPTFWLTNHGVAETEADMRALIAGAAKASAEPVSFPLPVRQASLFRWCLSGGLRVVKPMTLMAVGTYQEPKGVWFPSVFY
jgi:GNAT superfamily N-acetyltransferase